MANPKQLVLLMKIDNSKSEQSRADKENPDLVHDHTSTSNSNLMTLLIKTKLPK